MLFGMILFISGHVYFFATNNGNNGVSAFFLEILNTDAIQTPVCHLVQ